MKQIPAIKVSEAKPYLDQKIKKFWVDAFC